MPPIRGSHSQHVKAPAGSIILLARRQQRAGSISSYRCSGLYLSPQHRHRHTASPQTNNIDQAALIHDRAATSSPPPQPGIIISKQAPTAGHLQCRTVLQRHRAALCGIRCGGNPSRYQPTIKPCTRAYDPHPSRASQRNRLAAPCSQCISQHPGRPST